MSTTILSRLANAIPMTLSLGASAAFSAALFYDASRPDEAPAPATSANGGGEGGGKTGTSKKGEVGRKQSMLIWIF